MKEKIIVMIGVVIILLGLLVPLYITYSIFHPPTGYVTAIFDKTTLLLDEKNIVLEILGITDFPEYFEIKSISYEKIYMGESSYKVKFSINANEWEILKKKNIKFEDNTFEISTEYDGDTIIVICNKIVMDTNLDNNFKIIKKIVDKYL